MREILFRGKAINRNPKRKYRTKYKNGDWVYGLVTNTYDEDFPDIPITMRNTDGVDGIDVDYLTIGQYTGAKDKDGVKIFEGDIVDFLCPYGKLRGRVVYEEQQACFSIEGSNSLPIAMCNCIKYAVLGNIYDDKTTKY